MQRRNFLKSVSLSALAIPTISGKTFSNLVPASNNIIKPKRLKKGDTLGLIAPGSFINEDELKESIENLETLGFKVVYTKNILARYGYFGGTDEQRASDVNEMFKRTDVDGIVCARGGWGCSRILPLLDYDMIKNNPKVLIGYSDVTALLYGIFKETGLVCFHGPVGISTFNEYSVDYFRWVLMEPQETLTLYNPHYDKNKNGEEYFPFTIRSGKSSGQLVGGNLSIVVSLIGTQYDIDSENKIVFLEEVGEQPYRVDRMLTQMIEAGKFKNAKGIMLGVFEDSKPNPRKSGISSSFSLDEVLFDRLAKLKVPTAYGMSFGHITNKFTLPFGIEAEFDSLAQTLTLLEPAVV